MEPPIHPLSSVHAWASFLFGAAVLLFLPGTLLLAPGKRERHDAYSAISHGLALIIVVGHVLSMANLRLNAWTFLAFVGLAVSIRLFRAWKHAASPRISSPLPRALGSDALPAITSIVLFAVLVFSLRDLVVPPTPHDAANHAFLVQRILETRSVALDEIFGPPWGAPTTLYFLGWHIPAALISDLTGLPGYVSTWMLPLVALAALPLALAWAWRRLGLPATTTAVAAVLVLVGRYQPVGVLYWGGFGLLLGLFLAPWAAWTLVRAWRRPTTPNTLVAAIAISAQGLIHSSEGIAVFILAAAFGLACADPALFSAHSSLRRRTTQAILFLVILGTLFGTQAWQIARSYHELRMVPPAAKSLDARAAITTLLQPAGPFIEAQAALLAGFALALLRGSRSLRLLAIASLLLFLWAWGLLRHGDQAWIATLSDPFYREPTRILALQLFFVPILMATTLETLARLSRRTEAIVFGISLFLALGFTLRTWVAHIYPGLRGTWLREQAVLDEAGFRFAREIRQYVPEDAWVANGWEDGTSWAMHISGRRYLIPCGWPIGGKGGGTYWRSAILGLPQTPWDSEVLALRDFGVNYLHVRDTHWNSPEPSPSPRDFLGDSRFEPLLLRDHDGLFRIRWETLRSSTVDSSAHLLTVSGFDAQENWGRWVTEGDAIVRLVRMGGWPDDRRFVLDITASDVQDRPQELTVVIDGSTRDSITLPMQPWTWSTWSWPLPATESDTLEVRFHFSHAWPDPSNPSRKLVCPVRSLRVERTMFRASGRLMPNKRRPR